MKSFFAKAVLLELKKGEEGSNYFYFSPQKNGKFHPPPPLKGELNRIHIGPRGPNRAFFHLSTD